MGPVFGAGLRLVDLTGFGGGLGPFFVSAELSAVLDLAGAEGVLELLHAALEDRGERFGLLDDRVFPLHALGGGEALDAVELPQDVDVGDRRGRGGI